MILCKRFTNMLGFDGEIDIFDWSERKLIQTLKLESSKHKISQEEQNPV